MDNSGNLPGQQGGDGIAYLVVLLRPVSLKEVVVRKGLQSRGLSNGQASALTGIRMNKVVAILRNMTGHGSAW